MAIIYHLGMNEADWTTWVISAARARGWRCGHFRPAQMQSGKWATAMQGDIGFPDVVLARNGVVLFRELKTEKGPLRPEQKVWLEALGDIAGVWRPRDRDLVLATLGPVPARVLPAPSGRVADLSAIQTTRRRAT